MDKDKKSSKTSTYQMLKGLDKIVTSRPKKDYYGRNDDYDYSIPDRSSGDLYCKACDSHMNSEQMWQAHIIGKRHLKNTKNGDVLEKEIKYEVSLTDPIFLSHIKGRKETFIGLQHCCELQRPYERPSYQCFLCSANMPNAELLIDHVIGLKHRMAYLKEHDPVKHDLISRSELKKGMIAPVVAECIDLHFKKYGHGKMQVKVEIPKLPVKRQLDEDDFSRSNDSFKRGSYDDPRRDPYDDPRRDPYLEPRRDPYMESRKDPYLDPRKDPYDNISDRPSDRYAYESRSNDSINDKTHLLKDQAGSSSMDIDEKKNEVNRTISSNILDSLRCVMGSLPPMVFLELVLERVEKLDPSEEELGVLQKIGNLMISIVMERKLKKLTPVLTKFTEPVKSEESSISNNLKDLISQLKTSKQPSVQKPFQVPESTSEPVVNDPVFMTQSGSFFSSQSSVNIPGLS